MMAEHEPAVDDRPSVWHVYPLFGREHEMSKDCWCQPVPDYETPNVIVHNPEQ